MDMVASYLSRVQTGYRIEEISIPMIGVGTPFTVIPFNAYRVAVHLFFKTLGAGGLFLRMPSGLLVQWDLSSDTRIDWTWTSNQHLVYQEIVVQFSPGCSIQGFTVIKS